MYTIFNVIHQKTLLLNFSAVRIIYYSKKGSSHLILNSKNNFRGDEKYNSHKTVSAEEDAEARFLIK